MSSEEYEYEYEESGGSDEDKEYEYEYESSYEEKGSGESHSGSSDWDSDTSSDDQQEVDEDELAGKSKFEIALIKWGRRPETDDITKVKKPKKESDKKKKKDKKETVQIVTVKNTPFDPLKEHTQDDILKLSRNLGNPKWRRTFGDREVLDLVPEMIKYAATISPRLEFEVVLAAFNLNIDLIRKGKLEVSDIFDFNECFKLLEQLQASYAADPLNIYIIPHSAMEFNVELDDEELEFQRTATFKMIAVGAELVDDEYKKIQQLTDHHDEVFRKVLEKLPCLIGLFWRVVQLGMNDPKLTSNCAELVTRIAFHLHFRTIPLLRMTLKAVKAEESTFPDPEDPMKFMRGLTLFVSKTKDLRNEKNRCLILLYYIFASAQNDDYKSAKHLLQGSKLFDKCIDLRDVNLQIFYNRAMVACGLAAFRAEEYRDVHNFLQEICAFTKQRELLAQGVSNPRKSEHKTEDFERRERTRLLPYHMHISTDLVELVHNICAMFVLAPVAAKQTHQNFNALKNLNKHYTHRLEAYVRQCNKAPPETSRDMVMHCLLTLKTGQAKEVREHICGMSALAQVATEKISYKQIIAGLSKKITEVGVHCFVACHGHKYESMRLSDLSHRFNITDDNTKEIINNVIMKSNFQARWNATGDVLCVSPRNITAPRHQRLLELCANVRF